MEDKDKKDKEVETNEKEEVNDSSDEVSEKDEESNSSKETETKEEKNTEDKDEFEEINSSMEAMSNEMKRLKAENEELKKYQSNNESDKFLTSQNVKDHLKGYVAKLLDGEEDKESAIKKIKQEAPELFKSGETSINESLSKPVPKDKKETSPDELRNQEKKLGY